MGFADSLQQKTGTEKYVNSGIGVKKPLDRTKLDYNQVAAGFDGFFRPGPRIGVYHLYMPQNCLNMGPHMHPGGELAFVIDGEYFDADMNGGVLRAYPRGSTVFYQAGSTHRPLSRDGSEIFYVAFDGIVFGKDAIDLMMKIKRAEAPEDTVEYALQWMFTPEERQRIMGELFST